jgi:nucleotide-binding universal stress UspA family protein
MSRPAGFRRILVPLDGSRLAESVLPVVTLLAHDLGAQIWLLHVVEERPPQAVHGEPHLTTAAAAEAYLAGVAARLGPGLTVETHVHSHGEPNVAASIARHVIELQADMIALCTHGPRDVRRVVAGSMGQQVGRRATTPVLLVRPQQPAPAQICDLLVPLDGTPAAARALPAAATLAHACHAAIRLVRVVPTLGTLTGDDAISARMTPSATAAALDAEVEEAQTGLAAAVEQLAAAGIAARAEVRRGDPTRTLVEAAQTATDLIVIAGHGRTGLGALWVGSVAAGVVNKAPQAVLLVPVTEPAPGAPA